MRREEKEWREKWKVAGYTGRKERKRKEGTT